MTIDYDSYLKTEDMIEIVTRYFGDDVRWAKAFWGEKFYQGVVFGVRVKDYQLFRNIGAQDTASALAYIERLFSELETFYLSEANRCIDDLCRNKGVVKEDWMNTNYERGNVCKAYENFFETLSKALGICYTLAAQLAAILEKSKDRDAFDSFFEGAEASVTLNLPNLAQLFYGNSKLAKEYIELREQYLAAHATVGSIIGDEFFDAITAIPTYLWNADVAETLDQIKAL